MRVLSWFIFAYWVFALANVILNLILIRRPRRHPNSRQPLLSIIIPARNEERAIGQTVRAFLAQDYPNFELIVVNDRSTDSTASILAAIHDARLIVLTGEEPPAGWLGKPWALHQGSQRAKGEILLFVDADIDYQPQAVSAAVDHMEWSGAAMTSILPFFDMRTFGEHAAMPNLAMAAYFIPLWLGELLSLWPLAIGGGTGNLIRRDAYDEVGGHQTMRSAVIDDVGFAQHVRRSGHKTRLLQADRLVSVRMYHGLAEIVNGFTKNMFALVGHSVIGALLALSVFSLFHVVPYVLAILGDRIAIATVILIVVTRVVLFAGLRYPIWSAVLLHPLQTAIWVWIMLRSAWIVGIRGELTWRGRTYDPAHTRFGADPGRRSQ